MSLILPSFAVCFVWVFFFFSGSRAQACLVAHSEGCKGGRSTQHFPLNVKKEVYVVIFSEPWIFGLKGEKGVVITPSLALYSSV